MKDFLKTQGGIVLAAIIIIAFAVTNAFGAPVDDGYTQLLVGVLVGGSAVGQVTYRAGKTKGISEGGAE